MKWMPGTPSSSSRAHIAAACSMPELRAPPPGRRRPARTAAASAGGNGAPDSCSERSIVRHARSPASRRPGSGSSQPAARDPVAQAQVVVGVEEHLGDREVGAGPALARRSSRCRSRCRASADACTGTRPRRRRSRRTPGPGGPGPRRRSRPRGWRTHSPVGSPGGSPRTASTLRTPAPASRPITLRSSATEWLTAVRWAIGSSVVSVAIRSVTATVVSRVEPPAP